MFNNPKKDSSRNPEEMALKAQIATHQTIENSNASVTNSADIIIKPTDIADLKQDEDSDMNAIDSLIQKTEMAMRNRRILSLETGNKNKECVQFKFSVYVLGVTRLDSQTESYRSRFEVSCFTQMTKQQKLNYIKNPDEYSPKDFMQVYSLNTVEILERKAMTFHNNKQFVIYYDEDFKSLSIANIWWINAELSEPLELGNFPFDVQHLEIPITFEFRDQNYMRDYKHKLMSEYCLFMFMDGVLNLNGWNMDKPHLEFKCIEYSNFPPKYAFMRFTVQREWRFYLKRVIVILGIISLLTNLTFIFGDISESIADRFAYLSTMFLSAVAYMFVITTYLPQLRYLTILDKYTFFTFGFIFLIAVETAFVEAVDDDIEVNFDRIFFIANFIFWAVMHIVFVVLSYRAFIEEQEKHNLIKEKVDAMSGGGNEYPLAVFGRKGGYDRIVDYNGAQIYFKTKFEAGYDDLPHVRYGAA